MQTANFEDLKERLLAMGGDNVMGTPEMPIDIILKKGRLFSTTGRKRVNGLPWQCNQNVALSFLSQAHFGHPGAIHIVIGYGLHNGAWWAHSWLWDGRRVLETCVKHNVYFGVLLGDAEASSFVLQAVRRVVPVP